jgi:hypothetical protein
VRKSGLQQRWVIQPLFDAGLGLDDVRILLFRVSFEWLVSGCDLSDVSAFLGPQPAAVRAAWIDTVDRMLRHDELLAGTL